MLAIYTRLSREDEASNSINNQLREGKAFAKDNGFKEYEIYNEGMGISGGAKIKDRPQLSKLMQDIEQGKIKAVWFRNDSRLARKNATYHLFIEECRENNCRIFFADEEFNYNNPEKWLMKGIRAEFNEYRNLAQSAQTKKTLRDNAKEGKSRGIYPYGYKSNNGYFAINETESKIVESIYNMSLSGIGTDSIAIHLNKEGVPTRKYKRWAGRTIQGIIKNPIYKGEIHHLKSRKDEDLHNREIEVFNTAPIIIDPILWQKVNDNLHNNRNNSGKKVDHKYLLKGLLKCGKCGRNYYGRRRVDKSDNYYGCSSFRRSELKCGNRGINIDVLEHFVWQRFFADKRILELTKDFLKKDEIEAKLSDLRTENTNLEKDLKTLEKERKKALELLIKEVISEEDFSEIKRNNEVKKNELNQRIKNNSEQIAFYESSELTTESVNNDLKRLEGASFNDKRDLIKKYIERITILYNGSIKMYTIRVDFKISNYFPNDNSNPIYKDLNIKSDKLTEIYLIDRNYDLAVDFDFKFFFPLSSKAINEIGRKSILSYGAKSQDKVSIDVTNFKVWVEFIELKNSLREL